MLHRKILAVAVAAPGLVLWPTSAVAQERELVQRCAAVAMRSPASPDAIRFCNLVAQAIEIAQPVVGLAATGGNPVPGTASTMGMRLGTLPRVSLAARATGVFADLPPILDFGDRGEIGVFVPSLNVDGAIGILSGLTLAPTVGGVGSVDGLLSVGVIPLPGGEDGFRDSPWTVGAGLRVGILRESFTMPGISVTGMYRRVGGFTFGDRDLTMDDSFFDMNMGIWSLRGTIGKRIAFLGLTLGAAYDHYSSDVEFALRDPQGLAGSPIRISVDDFENDRFALFGNVSWTLLILSLVAEIGWQSGADAVPAPLPANIDFDAEGSRFFGSLALRLSI